MKEFKLNNRTNVKGLIHQKTIDYLETEEEKNYIEYRDKFDKASNFKIYDYPIHIDLEIDNICNLLGFVNWTARYEAWKMVSN